MSLIQSAYKDGWPVSLEEARRYEVGLTCPTCGEKLIVKDGCGQFVAGKSPRNRSKGKHFAHTASSGCHGEGPVHYRVKMALCHAINLALKMPEGERNFHGSISYLCPDTEYGPKDMIKFAPGAGGLNHKFVQMQHGYHHYDLLRCSTRPTWTAPVLDHAECEVWLDHGRTRADIAGFDKDGNVLWAIEIKRSTLSQVAIDHARTKGIPLFVIDLTHLPKVSADDPTAETESMGYHILGENLVRGSYPCANESVNTECARKAIGMGPDDRSWSKWCHYVHRGPGNGDHDWCPDCEEVVLHQCGESPCPDEEYRFKHGIDALTMYGDPIHRAHSHIPLPQGVVD